MFLLAPETKGRTLEEMDEVFDSGIPAWRSKGQVTGRLERLAADIEAGNVRVDAPGAHALHTADSTSPAASEKQGHATTVAA